MKREEGRVALLLLGVPRKTWGRREVRRLSVDCGYRCFKSMWKVILFYIYFSQ